MRNRMKYSIPIALAVLFCSTIYSWANSNICEISFETIPQKTSPSHICMSIDDILKIGISETAIETKIEIFFMHQSITELYAMTATNIGEKLILRINESYIYSGVIAEPLSGEGISFKVKNFDEALSILDKIGVEPDYHNKSMHSKNTESNSSRKGAENPWYQKALQLLNQGNYDLAVEYQKKAIDEEPTDPLQYAALSTIYYLQNRKSMALVELENAERLIERKDINKYPGIFLGLAELYSEMGDHDRSETSYKKLIENNNQNLRARVGLAQLYEKIGRKKEALQEYQSLVESKDKHYKTIGEAGVDRLR